jgi:hypothetical protein
MIRFSEWAARNGDQLRSSAIDLSRKLCDAEGAAQMSQANRPDVMMSV